jgi:hypothetical protein
MKKIFLVGALAFLGLTSCKKDYTCECTSTVDMGELGKTSASASTTINDTKANATEACDAGDSKSTSGLYSSSVDCEIK